MLGLSDLGGKPSQASLPIPYHPLPHRTLSGTGGEGLQAARQWTRDEAERGLTLAGLMVVDCPLKKDTAGVIAELQVRHITRRVSML